MPNKAAIYFDFEGKEPAKTVETDEQRFFRSFKKDESTGCWLWQKGRGHGYGVVKFRGKQRGAHRVSLYIFRGVSFQTTLVADHLCRVRRCVNPDHLEMVTERTNILRGTARSAINAKKTHCPKGHPLSGENLRESAGARYCRTCQNAQGRIYNQKRKKKINLTKGVL